MNPQPTPLRALRWRYGLLAAFAMLLLAIFPEVSFRVSRGSDWNGTQAYAHGDEVVYAAYANALIDGRPRRNDPYTGADLGEPTHGKGLLPESYFSIQFLPAYAVAIPARLAGATTAQAFVALTCAAAILSSLAVFWLVATLTGDEPVAAAAVIFVLCFGSAHLVMEYALGLGVSNNYLSFMRRYVPSAPFPFFFIFCALIWRMLAAAENRRAAFAYALGAGTVFALLVYSYFYLWTTAAAWFCCFALLWLVAGSGPRAEGQQQQPDARLRRRSDLALFGTVAALGLVALTPYFILLSRRAEATDEGLWLTPSHAPDLFRLHELLGFGVLAALLLSARRGLIEWRDRVVLITASFALTPFFVFNQQVITGRSLQPFHYGMFIVNYVAVLSALLSAVLIWRAIGRRGIPHGRSGVAEEKTRDEMARTAVRPAYGASLLLLLTLVAYGSGAFQSVLASKRFWQANLLRDRARPASLRLAALAREGADRPSDTRPPVVLATDFTVADALPTVAPQPVLWAPHLYNFPGATLQEDRARLARYLYYSGIDFSDVDASRFAELDGGRRYLISALIRRARHNPNLSVDWTPITTAEVQSALDFYADFKATFGRRQAEHPVLSYLLTGAGEQVDFSNLDRWYERDAGERIGDYTLYRLTLRPGESSAGE